MIIGTNPYEGLRLFRVQIIRGQGIVKITSRDRGRLTLGYIDWEKRGDKNDIILKFWAESEEIARRFATDQCTVDWDFLPKFTSNK